MRRATSLLLVFALVGCGSTSPIVGVEYNRHYDFSKRETYAWQPGVPAPREESQQLIVASIDQALAERGFRRIEDGNPDLQVFTEAYGRLRGESGVEPDVVSSPAIPRYDERPDEAEIEDRPGEQPKEELNIGRLLIGILDGKTGELVWRATGIEILTDDPVETKVTIDKAVAASFAAFPPEPVAEKP